MRYGAPGLACSRPNPVCSRPATLLLRDMAHSWPTLRRRMTSSRSWIRYIQKALRSRWYGRRRLVLAGSAHVGH